jgi:hypothetical protein|tara:strand:+ start:7073 stop:7627 length:555 start_codon:yes stop_codon:yes gene_type:complete
MNHLALKRIILLGKIAPEEDASIYNEDEVMLLLSELYRDRISEQEIRDLEIKWVYFRCCHCNKGFGKKREVNYLKHFIKCQETILKKVHKGKEKILKKKSEKSEKFFKEKYEKFFKEKYENKINKEYNKRVKFLPKSLNQLRKKKLKEIIANDIDNYQDSEINFMLENVYKKKLNSTDKEILML